jgi:hypothetical protein
MLRMTRFTASFKSCLLMEVSDIFRKIFQLIKFVIVNITMDKKKAMMQIKVYADDMYIFAFTVSFAVKASVTRFLRPFPIPISKVSIHDRTEIIVNQTPRTLSFEKYFIYAGVVKKPTKREAPRTK